MDKGITSQYMIPWALLFYAFSRSQTWEEALYPHGFAATAVFVLFANALIYIIHFLGAASADQPLVELPVRISDE